MQESLNIIKHRGPDNSGVWISTDEKIGRYGNLVKCPNPKLDQRR